MLLLTYMIRRCFMKSRKDKYALKEENKFQRTKKNTQLYADVYEDIYKDTTYMNFILHIFYTNSYIMLYLKLPANTPARISHYCFQKTTFQKPPSYNAPWAKMIKHLLNQ